jgi:hypothetical protein
MKSFSPSMITDVELAVGRRHIYGNQALEGNYLKNKL